jgi:hypothetical protein
MELSDLKTTLTELSEQELFDLIKGIRASRRTPKATTSTKPKQNLQQVQMPCSVLFPLNKLKILLNRWRLCNDEY